MSGDFAYTDSWPTYRQRSSAICAYFASAVCSNDAERPVQLQALLKSDSVQTEFTANEKRETIRT